MTKDKFKIMNVMENPTKSIYELTVHFNYLWESREKISFDGDGNEVSTVEEGYVKTESQRIEVPLVMNREQILTHLNRIYESTYSVKSGIEESIKSVLDLKGYTEI